MASELDKLQRENEQLRARMEELTQENGKLRDDNRDLQRRLDYVIKQLFGRKSEKLDPNQLELHLGIESQELPDLRPALASGSRPRSIRPRKARLPDDLPTEEIFIDPPEVETDRDAYKIIGQEVTEELDVKPPRYFRRLIIRRKYQRRDQRAAPPIIGALPARLIEHSFASPGLLADIVVQKYIDHLPLYRQEQILRQRFNIELSRKTMSEWVRIVADWLKPIYGYIATGLRASGYLQIDETPIRYNQAEKGGSGQGYFWVYHHPGGDVLYEWHTSRAARCLDGMLGEFSGTVQCDGYSAYPSYVSNREDIVLALCMAHARRKFVEATEDASPLATWVLNQFQHLYRIEAELRERKAGPHLRQAVRAAQSDMILRRLRRVFETKLTGHLPQNPMGKALRYALGHWEGLCRYVQDGQLEIDNNLVENAVRPTALGKRNWLFIGHPEAGERSAIIYSILECCKRRGINPHEYLGDVLSRLPSMTNQQVHTLTPAAWAAARKEQVA